MGYEEDAAALEVGAGILALLAAISGLADARTGCICYCYAVTLRCCSEARALALASDRRYYSASLVVALAEAIWRACPVASGAPAVDADEVVL